MLYCSLAGFIAAWTISGLLTIVDFMSQTPPGTFFGVIGISLGFYDPTIVQYRIYSAFINRINCRQYIWTDSFILERVIPV